MIAGHALLIAGVALYALAGSALSRQTARAPGRRAKWWRAWLLLVLGVVLSLACLVWGITVVDRVLGLRAVFLPLWSLTALCVAPAVLVAVGLAVLALRSPPSDGDDGGSGPDDLPPPPDPDGPDGWAEFERQFRAYARARDASRSSPVLVLR